MSRATGRYRQGSQVPINVYDPQGRPIFQAHSEESAADLVSLLNKGNRVETITLDDIAERIRAAVYADIDEHLEGVEAAARDVLDLFTSTESPLSAPETASEPSDAPEGHGDVGSVVRRSREWFEANFPTVAPKGAQNSPEARAAIENERHENVLDWIRRNYHVPAHMGSRVTVAGRPGIVTGAQDARLLVTFDDGETWPCHPTWNVVYR